MGHRNAPLSPETPTQRQSRGEILPGGRCDIKTLAAEANFDRTAFYGNRPHAPCAPSSNAACRPSSKPGIVGPA